MGRGGRNALEFLQRRALVGTVHGSRIGESLPSLRGLLEIQIGKAQPVLVSRVNGIIALQQRRRLGQILHRRGVLFFLQVNLSESAQRNAFLQSDLFLPVGIGDTFRLLSRVAKRGGLLGILLRFVEVFTLFAVVIG